ncbi:MAG: flagellar basal body-associated protein FliL [Planctomycetota bacterium]
MAGEEKAVEESDEGGKGGGGKRLMGIIATALIAGAAGAGGSIVVQRSSLLSGPGSDEGAQEEAVAASDASAATDADSAANFQQRLLSLEPVVVNIAGNGFGRFLKVSVELETDSVATREELEIRLPQLKDAIITLMSSKRIADISDFEGKVLLKEDLRDRINQILASGSVDSVLFTEFVVQ